MCVLMYVCGEVNEKIERRNNSSPAPVVKETAGTLHSGMQGNFIVYLFSSSLTAPWNCGALRPRSFAYRASLLPVVSGLQVLDRYPAYCFSCCSDCNGEA